MKKISKQLMMTAVASVLFSSAALMAESQYGYSSSGVIGTGGLTAQADVKITVTVPNLILLRVGSANTTVDELTFTGTPSIPAVPTNPADGNNVSVDWDGTAPTFSAATAQTLRAFSWTNSAGGGEVDCAVTTAFPAASNLLPSHVTITSTAVTNGGLAHPGADSACGTPTSFARNTLVSSDWEYQVTAAGMAAAAPGTYSQTMTYTATAL
ncbi:MAG: hypothetical protein R3F02_15520 [Thiolinea sp.]